MYTLKVPIDEADDMKAARQGISAVRDFFKSLGMPVTLSEAQIPGKHFEEMGKKACVFGKIGGFKRLDESDVVAILKNAV